MCGGCGSVGEVVHDEVLDSRAETIGDTCSAARKEARRNGKVERETER